MDCMDNYIAPPSKVRHGRFLWMPEQSRKDYLNALREKIESHYFFSDSVFVQLAEDLAPLYIESTGSD
jgi:hypothetical protein